MFEAGVKETHAIKAANTFAPLAEVNEGPTAIADMLATEIEYLKGALKPGQVMKDVCIGTPIRHDRSNVLFKQLQDSGLPIEGTVCSAQCMVCRRYCV
jgi:hypothetical protein